MENLLKSRLIAVGRSETAELLNQLLERCGAADYTVVLCGDQELELLMEQFQPAVLVADEECPSGWVEKFPVCVVDYDIAVVPPSGWAGRLLTYSVQSDNADFTARNVRLTEGGVAFEIVGVGVIGRVKLAGGDAEQLKTYLTVVSAALAAGLPFAEVLEKL